MYTLGHPQRIRLQRRLYPSRKTSSSVFVFPTLLLQGYFKPLSMEFLVTHSREILKTLSMEFLVTNSKEISCYQFCRKPGENVNKICGNCWEFPAKSSLEPIPGNFSQDFLKSSSRIS